MLFQPGYQEHHSYSFQKEIKMSKVISVFDYVHFRIYNFSKQKGDSSPETNGTLILTLLQCFTILDLMIAVQIIHDYPFPSKYAFLPLLAIVGIVNWYRYERNFDAQKIEGKWQSEGKKNRVRNGWLIAVYMLIAFLIPPLYGYLKINLKGL